MRLQFYLFFLYLGILALQPSWAAPVTDEGAVDFEAVPDEGDSEAVEEEEEDRTEEDPRLGRMRRQALFPYYPVTFSTRGTRRGRVRLSYPYVYPYYTYPYTHNYPFSSYLPYYPYFPPGTNTQPTATNVCRCAASDANCISQCLGNAVFTTG